MRTLLLPLLLFVTLSAGCLGFITRDSEDTDSEILYEQLLPYNQSITEDFLMNHLSVIAHDSLRGRETGMAGQKSAARYLSDYYADLGFTPVGDDDTFYQTFTLEAQQKDSLVFSTYRIEGADTLLVNHSITAEDSPSEYIQIFGGSIPLAGDIVYAGFGINDPERDVFHLDGVDLSNKWVLMFENIPYVMDGDTLINPEISYNQRFSDIISKNGARGVLVIGDQSQEEFETLSELDSRLLTKPENLTLKYLDGMARRRGYPRGYLQISPELATEILELDDLSQLQEMKEELTARIHEFRPEPLSWFLDYRPYSRTVEFDSENILAFYEGADPELKEEVVVLTAHYDHIGITMPDDTGDFINNGADDNGSGTVALMSIANALKQAADEGIRTRRSILFLHVSAEEAGLLGSRYYSDHPVFPIEKTVANYNADMIGRSTPERVESGETDYIFIIGGDIISSELDSLVHVANDSSVQMELDYSYNDLNDPNQFYRRSDHWNLGRLEVPFVFFFTGTHEDYHRPGDTLDKLDVPKLVRTSRLIFASTLQIANYGKAPEVDNQQFIDITRSNPR